MGRTSIRRPAVNFLCYFAHVIRTTISMHCFRFAIKVSIFPVIAAVVVSITDNKFDYLKDIVPEDSVYNNLRTLISLCIVFHTVQSYARFMGGLTLVYQLLGDLHETVSLLVTFSSHSKGSSEDKKRGFQNTLVRLCSMMFALCIAELEAGEDEDEKNKQALSYTLIDPEGLDTKTLKLVIDAKDRPVCVYQRLLDLMMDAFTNGVIGAPAPLFTRCFQELGNAMIKYHECLKFKDAPFPFPFMIITDTLLMVYTLTTPFMYSHWTHSPYIAGCLTFVTVFCIWLLHCVADELDNPFGYDAADLKAGKLTADLNHQLLVLLANANSPAPSESEDAVKDLAAILWRSDMPHSCDSFSGVFNKIREMDKTNDTSQTLARLSDQDFSSPLSPPSSGVMGASEKATPSTVDIDSTACSWQPVAKSSLTSEVPTGSPRTPSGALPPSRGDGQGMENALASEAHLEPPRTPPKSGEQTSQIISDRGQGMPTGSSHGNALAEETCRADRSVMLAKAQAKADDHAQETPRCETCKERAVTLAKVQEHSNNDLLGIVVELSDAKTKSVMVTL